MFKVLFNIIKILFYVFLAAIIIMLSWESDNTLIFPIVLAAFLAPFALAIDRFIKARKLQRATEARSKIEEANSCYANAQKAKNLAEFIDNWKQMISILDDLSKNYEGKVDFQNTSPTEQKKSLSEEYEWRLRNAIEDSMNHSIKTINTVYRNSTAMKIKAYNEYLNSIEYADSYSALSEETRAFATKAASRVALSAGYYEETDSTPTRADRTGELISDIDKMKGSEFEDWCANLLRYNGYENVRTTKSSGDQGVDILAEKDDIMYAIQCKCHSHDLSNTPIQEVNTGKTLYHCQIGVVMTNRRFTKGAKEAANATGVLLWDRDKLCSMLRNAEEN